MDGIIWASITDSGHTYGVRACLGFIGTVCGCFADLRGIALDGERVGLLGKGVCGYGGCHIPLCQIEGCG